MTNKLGRKISQSFRDQFRNRSRGKVYQIICNKYPCGPWKKIGIILVNSKTLPRKLPSAICSTFEYAVCPLDFRVYTEKEDLKVKKVLDRNQR